MNKYFSEEEVIIQQSSIGTNCRLYKSSEVTLSKLSQNCSVGNFSRIRHSHLGNYVRIDRNNFIFHSRIGDYSYTGNGDVIMHANIGKFCSISWGCTIGPGEHDYSRITTHDFLYNDFYNIRPQNSEMPYNRYEKQMKIGNDVWIGCGVTILRGCKIGNGAVIGANSVVKDDVPPYSIVAGSPAKIIKYRFTKEIIQKLEELQWWKLPRTVIKENYDLFKEKDISNTIVELTKIKHKIKL